MAVSVAVSVAVLAEYLVKTGGVATSMEDSRSGRKWDQSPARV